MAWDLNATKIENFLEFDIPYSIDIIAPTWFSLTNDKELFEDISNDEYIKYVKSQNKEVWAVFNNNFDPDVTSELLNDGIKRSEIVDKMISITLDSGFDAINLDFENMYFRDKDVFAAFVKELYCKARDEKISLSVDVTILSNNENWSLVYDRKAISKYSDLVILMAYDENVSGTVGSVSSIPWVEYGISNLLECTVAEKIVLGIPFYTRLWKEYEEDGEIVTVSSAYKIQSASNKIEELKIKLNYDEESGQNYGELVVDGVTYRIWNEDSASLKNRLDLVKKYDLAGLAVWQLRYGTDEMWGLIE
jgi:spore germination protein YaaH